MAVVVVASLLVAATQSARLGTAARKLAFIGEGFWSSVAAAQPAANEVTVNVDAAHPLRPLDPNIYGVAAADAAQLAATGATVNRWGGNPTSRFNWTSGTDWNAARDWEFRNVTGASADDFIARNRTAGVQTVLTVPALGWVARNGDNATRSVGVPPIGGPPVTPGSDAIAGYDPTDNQRLTSLPSQARKGAPFADPPVASDRVYEDEWINHLVHRFGAADQGGVAYYVVDNEPDLWAFTHTDVHPVEPSYDDMLSTFLDYATAIKSVDPTANVLGPALSGWTSYFYSARDRGSDTYRTHADRLAHGDMPFLPWWLDQVRQHDEHTGQRSLDVLDVHFYPQADGVYSGATDPATNRLRLRSTRALWDPTYVDESWIADRVELIPRLKQWIDQYYPGTRLAIDEWNWGADQTMNGALAIADVLGIFGREGVDMAAYWTSPPAGSPGSYAFSMYTNYDGQGHGFGDNAVAATSSSPDDVSSYGSVDSATGALLVMMINKRADADVATTVHLSPGFGTQVSLIRYDGSGPPAQIAPLVTTGDQVHLTLPASTITLLRFLPPSP
jgi:hypothetical protein